MIGDASNPRLPVHLLHADEVELHGGHGMPSWQYPSMLDAIATGRLDLGRLPVELVDLRVGVDHLRAMGTFGGTGFTVIDSLDSTPIVDHPTKSGA